MEWRVNYYIVTHDVKQRWSEIVTEREWIIACECKLFFHWTWLLRITILIEQYSRRNNTSIYELNIFDEFNRLNFHKKVRRNEWHVM